MMLLPWIALCLAGPSGATVEPAREQLKQAAQLIVRARILSVRQVAYKGPRGERPESDPATELEVRLKPTRLLKGSPGPGALRFAYPDRTDEGHLLQECIGRKRCARFPTEERTFYLLDRGRDPRFARHGASGFVLVDSWFGME